MDHVSYCLGVRLGVKTRVFHLGDYRRATVGPGQDVPDDYFFVNGEENCELAECELVIEALDDGAFDGDVQFWHHNDSEVLEQLSSQVD